MLFNVIIKYSDSPPTSGEVEIQSFSKRQRLISCIKAWGICWVLAVGAVFLPVLHFFAVPALFILGPIVGFYKFGQKDRVLGGRGQCPACQAELPIEKGTLRWPLEELCTACRRTVKIERFTFT